MNNFKNRKGFTIVELVIVIAVIAILAGVLIPTFSGVVSRANESAAVQTTRTALSNVLSGNVKNGVLNAAEFVINNGSKTYQFSYANGQLITEDKEDKKAGEDNVSTNLGLSGITGDETAYKDGDTKVCQYKTIILKSAQSITDKKIQTAVNRVFGVTSDTLTYSIATGDGGKTLVVESGETQIVTFDLFYNSDFADNVIAFIK